MLNVFTVSPKASFLYGYDMTDPGYAEISKFYKKQLMFLLGFDDQIRAYNGGMIGADMIFANACADLRDNGKNIFCAMYVPYSNHDERWDDANKKFFRSTAARMDEVRLNQERYNKMSIFSRNDWFMSCCQVCLAVTGKEERSEVFRVMNECLRRKIKVIRFANGEASIYKGVKRMFVDTGH